MENNLKKLRQDLGLSYRRLSKLLGINPSAINDLEKGYNSFTNKTIELLTNFFAFDTNLLLSGKGCYIATIGNDMELIPIPDWLYERARANNEVQEMTTATRVYRKIVGETGRLYASLYNLANERLDNKRLEQIIKYIKRTR
jgi:transcriptional regulator with XRE-family HTH domain